MSRQARRTLFRSGPPPTRARQISEPQNGPKPWDFRASQVPSPLLPVHGLADLGLSAKKHARQASLTCEFAFPQTRHAQTEAKLPDVPKRGGPTPEGAKTTVRTRGAQTKHVHTAPSHGAQTARRAQVTPKQGGRKLPKRLATKLGARKLVGARTNARRVPKPRETAKWDFRASQVPSPLLPMHGLADLGLSAKKHARQGELDLRIQQWLALSPNYQTCPNEGPTPEGAKTARGLKGVHTAPAKHALHGAVCPDQGTRKLIPNPRMLGGGAQIRGTQTSAPKPRRRTSATTKTRGAQSQGGHTAQKARRKSEVCRAKGAQTGCPPTRRAPAKHARAFNSSA